MLANYEELFRYFDKWMKNRENNYTIDKYLNKMNITRIAIYGYGVLGKHLYFELKQSNISIEWIMDKNVKLSDENIVVKTPNEIGTMPKVDLIIIASGSSSEEIEKFLMLNGFENIVSLYEVIESISWSGL